MSDPLLDVRTVARRLSRCEETIRRYIRRGILVAIRAPSPSRGGNFLIPESSVLHFLATSSHPKAPHP